MTIELTDAEAAKVRECLLSIVVTGPTDALREHVRTVDAVLAKLLEAADRPTGSVVQGTTRQEEKTDAG